MHELSTSSLRLGYEDTIIIDDLDITIPIGKITVLIGSNGCGKSTLLRSLARLLKPHGGSVVLDGKDLVTLSTEEVAKRLAILPQSSIAPEGLTVLQLVKQGRYPYQNWINQWSQEDEKAVRFSLKVTNTEGLIEKKVSTLSGGQKQRVWLAMTLAQDTNIVLLDEPTTFLDVSHQIEILDLLYDLNKKQGKTIVMVLHDVNLACRYAEHMIALKNKKIYKEGPPEELITPKSVLDVFGLHCQVETDPLTGTPLCIPYGRGRIIKKNLMDH
ncbi:ABC transporter ATP-binding protein [Radiobacillus deserti]|uniref:ABC transporter ATP-binding protein n=1 Tax=Radiobacillus deserti TaxID=2594883 RepID=UPI00188AF1FE|nr:ABC transporter ATP-binding protein [Radiobacillus deserti]